MPRHPEQLDQEIIRVQQSTRTLFGPFVPLHNRLRMRFPWYYRWHLHPLSRSVHYGGLILYLMAVLLFGVSYLSQQKPTFALPVAEPTGFPDVGEVPAEPPGPHGKRLLFHLDFNGGFTNTTNNARGDSKGLKYVSGKFGQGGQFDKKARIAHLAKRHIDYTQGTLEVYFKPDWGGDTKEYHYIVQANVVGPRDRFTEQSVIKLVRFSDKNLYFEVHDDSNNASWVKVPTDDWQPDQWKHIAATWGKGGLKLYVNGEKVDEKVSGLKLPKGENSFIVVGNFTGGDLGAGGVLDEVSIWEYQKSDEEIRNDYTGDQPF